MKDWLLGLGGAVVLVAYVYLAAWLVAGDLLAALGGGMLMLLALAVLLIVAVIFD